jgi:hypothetical protein
MTFKYEFHQKKLINFILLTRTKKKGGDGGHWPTFFWQKVLISAEFSPIFISMIEHGPLDIH